MLFGIKCIFKIYNPLIKDLIKTERGYERWYTDSDQHSILGFRNINIVYKEIQKLNSLYQQHVTYVVEELNEICSREIVPR